ncbi:MAG: MBL fold metallo-hydrolase [Anaerolineae bacterium]|nr:MBL fold metallo-hydrolase [Anaerolineae bacterium]
MTIKIIKLTLGVLETNCYIVGDTATGDAIVIDPADQADLIRQTVSKQGWTVRLILATHGHFDHILASADLKAATGVPFRVHKADLPLVQAMPQIVQEWLGAEVGPAAEPDGFVSEGDTITMGGITLDVLFTPGHSPGHVSYVLRGENTVFSGDVLFYESIGRADLPGGDYSTLMESIVNKLLPLGDAVKVMPGHMQDTTIGHERQHNPYVTEYLRSRAQ